MLSVDVEEDGEGGEGSSAREPHGEELPEELGVVGGGILGVVDLRDFEIVNEECWFFFQEN